MEKIYVIYNETVLGFVETEQEAKRVKDALRHTQTEDCKLIAELKSRCVCCEGYTADCFKCQVKNEIGRINRKDMYRSCCGDVSYHYRELKKMF